MWHYDGYQSFSSNVNDRTTRRLTIKRTMGRLTILSLLLFGSFMFGTFMNVFANANYDVISENEMIEVSMQKDHPDESLEIKRTVDVRPGDTLWSIAQEHAPPKVNPRYYVQQLMAVNDLDNHIIYVDQLLYLP